MQKTAGISGLNPTTQAESSTSTWYAFAGHVIRRRTLPHFGGVFGVQATFAKPELYAALEERDVKYAIRLPANYTLERNIRQLLTRPLGRPSYSQWCASRASSTRRRVGRRHGGWWRRSSSMLGSCSPGSGLSSPTSGWRAGRWSAFTTNEGPAEQWIKEGKQAVENDAALLSPLPS